MEEDKDALEHLIFYINEFYAIKNTTMDLFLLFRKSKEEITKGKEAIEFEIRGRISFLTHWMGDRISQKSDYALASINHWTNLLKISQKEQPQALKMLDDLYQTYRKVSRVPHSQPIQVKEQIERMDTNDNN
jgi:hypothetical protein